MPSDTLCPITVRSDEGQPLSLALRGDLNIYQVHQLYEAAVALLPEESDVAVSCKDVVQIDAAVLQVLLVLQGDFEIPRQTHAIYGSLRGTPRTVGVGRRG